MSERGWCVKTSLGRLLLRSVNDTRHGSIDQFLRYEYEKINRRLWKEEQTRYHLECVEVKVEEICDNMKRSI
jgi:hypothetical protein